MRPRHVLSPLLALWLASAASLFADPPPIPKSDGAPVTPAKTGPAIRFPEKVPTPAPAPVDPPKPLDPAAATNIPADEIYVIDSDVELFVLCSPDGLVSITLDQGPLPIRARFVGGSGKIERKNFAGKFVYSIEAKVAGAGELIVWPKVGATDKDITRKLITTLAGPQPPPKVDPKPTPEPAPPPKPKVGDFRALFVYESSANLTKEQSAILNSTTIRAYLNSHCVKDTDGRPGWRCWDTDIDVSKDLKVWRDIWAATKPKLGDLPQVVVVIGTDGTTIPLPATEADTLALLKQYGGP